VINFISISYSDIYFHLPIGPLNSRPYYKSKMYEVIKPNHKIRLTLKHFCHVLTHVWLSAWLFVFVSMSYHDVSPMTTSTSVAYLLRKPMSFFYITRRTVTLSGFVKKVVGDRHIYQTKVYELNLYGIIRILQLGDLGCESMNVHWIVPSLCYKKKEGLGWKSRSKRFTLCTVRLHGLRTKSSHKW